MIADLRLRSIKAINANPNPPGHAILRPSGPSGGMRRENGPGGADDGAVVKASKLPNTSTLPKVGTVVGG